MTTTMPPKDTRGLAGQTIGDTEICSVNQTQLIYRGYEIADLAAHASFEEVAHLLLVGHRPSAAELTAFRSELAEMRAIPDGLKTLLRDIATDPPGAHPMGILRTGVSYLSHFDPDTEANDWEAELRKAKRLLASIPTIIGYGQMVRDGKDPVDPDPNLDHAANLLWCMTGQAPSEEARKVMDVSLVLYAEHDFNASSTFTGPRHLRPRSADMHGAVTAARSPRSEGPAPRRGQRDGDGDAQGDRCTLMQNVGTVRTFMQRAFTEKRKLMGFGHRVYKNGDHRAGILREHGLAVAREIGHEAQKWFDMGDEVQRIMLEEKHIHPNVDFPCGMTYFVLGIPVPQYTPIFVASRVTGWCAHIMEQHRDNRIIRPLANYTGPDLRSWND